MSARLPILAALLLASAALRAQQPVAFAVTPETLALAGGEPAVTRLYEVEYDVDGPDRATTRVRIVTTALRAAGREAAGRRAVSHGGFNVLRSFEGVLRDASGRIVHELDRRDVEDALVGSIYEDLRVRSAELYSDAYPFTVEWSYEVQHRGVLGWPTWRPQPGGLPVEYALFTLRVPTGTTVRPLARDVETLAVTTDGREEMHSWRLAQSPAISLDPYGPPWWEQAPELRLGTDHFEIGGAPGRLDSWEAFGAWYRGLSEGRQELPDGAKADVQRVIAGATTDYEKARRLYRYLQETTRYVSIQLGLGGWQPYDAEYVFERRYGDCKALTNYMQALLAEAGIESDPVLIEAGARGSDLDVDFPDNGFNHVILRVPMRAEEIERDAVWLECTSSFAAFGHLGSFTEGRPGLHVTPEGGRIVLTPTSTASDNRTRLDATLRLGESGDADADVRWTVHGEPRSDLLASLTSATATERALALSRMAGLASADASDLDLADLDARPDTVAIGATLRIPNAARRAAGRLLVPVAPFAPDVPALPASASRTQPVRLGHAYSLRDSVRIVPPEGYALHRSPEPVKLESVVGSYTLRAVAEADGLVVVRELVVAETEHPAEAYGEVRAFFAAVAEADGARAVFKAAR